MACFTASPVSFSPVSCLLKQDQVSNLRKASLSFSGKAFTSRRSQPFAFVLPAQWRQKKAVPRDDHQNFSRSNNSTHGSPGPNRTKKIFVGGLASSVTESDFKRYFVQFGTITDVVVMYDQNTA